MNPNRLIALKEKGASIPKSDLYDFINGYVLGTINDAIMTKLLKAIFRNGMDSEEIFTLTDIMIHSGKTMNFNHINAYVADKHSTGGVGDKTSLIVAPLLVAAGLKIPMMAGRSLGHTGGTLDKLETISGFNANVSLSEMQKLVETVGCGIMAQTDEICPADKKIYALRDVTGTVASIPLICGSIMSKKIAEGIQGLVLDIKVGSGAFMQTLDQARELGTMLQKIGEHFGVKTDLVYSSMNQPLGTFSGMWCEIQESLDCLMGKGQGDTMEVVNQLASKLMIQAGKAKSKTESNIILAGLIDNGAAYEKFIEIVENQGGDISTSFNEPKYKTVITAQMDGIIQSMDTTQIGWGLVEMGCGRKNKNDILDPTAGLERHKNIGDKVQTGDVLFTCFCSDESKLKAGIKKISGTVHIGDQLVKDTLIYM